MFFSVLFSVSILIGKQSNPKQKPASAATQTGTYNFSSGVLPDIEMIKYSSDDYEHKYSNLYLQQKIWIDSDTYQNNSTYIIDSFTGLKNFSYSVSKGYTFLGKKVLVTADIDCGGDFFESIGSFKFNTNKRYFEFVFGLYEDDTYTDNLDLSFPVTGADDYKKLFYQRLAFAGEFDGQNHKISNFKITNDARYNNTEQIESIYLYWNNNRATTIKGFFAMLGDGANIHNLHLDNYYIANAKGASNYTIMGGICGIALNGYTGRSDLDINITNCKVTNLTMIVDRVNQGKGCEINNGKVVMAGVLAMGGANIIDCYVENFASSCNGLTSAIGGRSFHDSDIDILNAVPLVIRPGEDSGMGFLGYDEVVIARHGAFGYGEKELLIINCIVKGYDYNFINNDKYSYPDGSLLKALALQRNTDNVRDSYYQTGCDYPISYFVKERAYEEYKIPAKVEQNYYVVIDSNISDYDSAGVSAGVYNQENEKQNALNWDNLGYDVSSIGGNGKLTTGMNVLADDTVWYYGGPNYNDGVPVLRSFVNWQEVEFKIETENDTADAGGYVKFVETNEKVKKLYIPAGLTLPEGTTDANNVINIYMQMVGPQISNLDYEFVKWTKTNNIYTANFKLIGYKFSITYNELYCSPKNASQIKEYRIASGEYIYFEYLKENNQLKISFKDIQKNKYEIFFNITKKYKPKDTTYIEIGSNYTLNLNVDYFELKTYGVVIT